MEGVKKDGEENPNINSSYYKKSFIIFRKELNNNKLNTTQCFAESNNKKVSFDLKDDKNFLSKSNIDKNLKAIKNEMTLRNGSAKYRKKNIDLNYPLLLNENKNIRMQSNINLDNTIKTNFFNSEDINNLNKRKSSDVFLDINNEINDNSDHERVEYRVSKDVLDINDKKSELIDLKKNNSEILSHIISHDKVFENVFNKNETEYLKRNNKEKDHSNINFESIPLKRKLDDLVEKLNNDDSKNKKGSFNSIIDYEDEKNDIKESNFQVFNFNNKPIIEDTFLEKNNEIEINKKRQKEEEKNFSNPESEKYIYESIDEFKNRIKYIKSNNESINIINDQFLQNEVNTYVANINSEENINSNEDDKILYQISDQNDDIKINDLINDKGNLTKINNISNKENSKNVNRNKLSNLSSINNSNKNKTEKDNVILENKKLINKTISIRDEQFDDDYKLEKISSHILIRNNKSTPKIHVNLNKNSKDFHFIEGKDIEFKNKKLENRKSVKNEEKLDSHCNVTVEESSIIYPLQFCYICDNLNQIDFVYNTETCNHSICFKCLKLFYEAKFDHNEFLLKCPIFTCDGKYKENLLKNIISEHYFLLLINNKSTLLINRTDLINNKNKPQIYQKEIISNEEVIISNENRASNIYKIESKKNHNSSNLKDNKNHLASKNCNANENETATNIYSNLKSYTKKNIVEINNLDNFLIYNKNKDNYCKKCNQPSLFNRPDKSTSKCLNCFVISCKYCLKQISYDHFDLNSFNYCKVYFRRKLKNLTIKYNNINKCKNFIISFLMLIASYILFFLNCFFSLSSFLRKLINLDKYENEINFFYFINNLNYRKYEYINDLMKDKKNIFYENHQRQKENVIDINNTKKNKTLKNLDDNLLIQIFKKDNLNTQEINKIEFNEDNAIKYNEYQKTMQFEDQINYNKSIIDKLKLCDKNLIKFIKSKLENGICLNSLRIREIFSRPDNRGQFYFEECKKDLNIEPEIKNKFYFEFLIKNLKNLKYFRRNKDFLIFKIFKYFIFYVFFLALGLILFVILILIIPYFPLLILIFQF